MEDDDLKKLVSPEIWDLAQRDSRLQIMRPGQTHNAVEDMRLRKTNLSAQTTGCWTLAKMALGYECKLQLVNGAGLTVVLDGMKQHVWNPQLQQIGLAVLRTLATLDRGVQRLQEVNALPQIVTVLRYHERDVVVQQNGIALLGTLMLADLKAGKLPDHEALEIFVEALRRHTYDETLQHRGCALLRQLVVDEELADELMGLGALKVVRWAIKYHPAVPEVQENAKAALPALEEAYRRNPGCGPYLWFAGGSVLVALLLFLCLHFALPPVAGWITNLLVSLGVTIASMLFLRKKEMI